MGADDSTLPQAVPPAGSNSGEAGSSASDTHADVTPAILPDSATGNRRPERVETLLVEGGVFGSWFLANRKDTRFFVLNLEKVLSDLNPNHTKTEAIFKSAKRIIAEETDWPAQYRFVYDSSHTQIFPDKRFKPKLFGHAATIIVAMELIAAEIDPHYNVYDHLRIMPATFFVDRFNRNQLMRLDAYYANLDAASRAEKFGDLVADDFERLALNAIEQRNSDRLLQQMVAGHTVTQWVCDRLRGFVAEHFPRELHLDQTRQSGDQNKADAEPGTSALGVKGAAPALRVPRFRPPDVLPLCR